MEKESGEYVENLPEISYEDWIKRNDPSNIWENFKVEEEKDNKAGGDVYKWIFGVVTTLATGVFLIFAEMYIRG